ncbi:hypothetical protein VARIO8X_130101 [Burkholderiales bacterium 8X]|nr:hypothetical protein VARIO8X_130101 [Burkholderiales bacterium 8X]
MRRGRRAGCLCRRTAGRLRHPGAGCRGGRGRVAGLRLGRRRRGPGQAEMGLPDRAHAGDQRRQDLQARTALAGRLQGGRGPGRRGLSRARSRRRSPAAGAARGRDRGAGADRCIGGGLGADGSGAQGAARRRHRPAADQVPGGAGLSFGHRPYGRRAAPPAPLARLTVPRRAKHLRKAPMSRAMRARYDP